MDAGRGKGRGESAANPFSIAAAAATATARTRGCRLEGSKLFQVVTTAEDGAGALDDDDPDMRRRRAHGSHCRAQLSEHEVGKRVAGGGIFERTSKS